MKKIFGVLIGLVFLFSASFAFGLDDTLTYTNKKLAGNVWVQTWTCTGASSGTTGYFTPTAAGEDIEGYVFLVTVDPDSGVTPTANYDITLNDGQGIDIMGGELGDRSATVEEQAVPLIDAVFGSRYVASPLTVTITNNSVASAVIIIRIYYYR